MNENNQLLREVRIWLCVFIAGLAISGLTAFPLYTEVRYAHESMKEFGISNALSRWIAIVYSGTSMVDKHYPFIAYGTDWLAFAHLMFAVLFVGIFKDPVKNLWVVQFGLISCLAILPLAFIAGSVRGIPFFWQLVDCSFGLLGGLVLWKCYAGVMALSRLRQKHAD